MPGPRPAAMRLGLWLAVCALVVGAALLVYQPWVNSGFDIEDFSEFRPILEQTHGTWDAARALTDYYTTQGRWNVTAYVALAAKWSLLGAVPTAWQWLRLLQLLAITAMTWWLLRGIGFGRVAAAAGAIPVMLFGPAATASFSRLTLSEPLALMFLIPAIALASGYRRTRRPATSALTIAILLALVVMTKEVLVVLVPAVAALGICWEAGHGWRRPRITRRELLLAGAVGAAVAGAGLQVLLVYLEAPPQAYAASYGAPRAPAELAALFIFMVFPVAGTVPTDVAALYWLPHVIALTLVLCGALLWVRRVVPGRQMVGWGAACLALPVAGVIAYVPWPRFEAFYAYPFAIAWAVLLCGTVTAADRCSRRAGLAAVSVVGLTGVLYAAAAQAHAGAYSARRAVLDRLADVVASGAAGDVVIVETQHGSTSWQAAAATIERAARGRAVSRGAVSRVMAARCGEASSRMPDAAHVTIVSFAAQCGEGSGGNASIIAQYRYWSWRSITRLEDGAYRLDVRRQP